MLPSLWLTLKRSLRLTLKRSLRLILKRKPSCRRRHARHFADAHPRRVEPANPSTPISQTKPSATTSASKTAATICAI